MQRAHYQYPGYLGHHPASRGRLTALIGKLRNKKLVFGGLGALVLFGSPLGAYAYAAHHATPAATHAAAQTPVPPAPQVQAVEPTATSAEAQPEPAANSSSSTNVTINGQNIPVPDNGSVHQTIPADNGNGQTTIDITSNSTNSSINAGSTSGSSVNLHVESHSTSAAAGDSVPGGIHVDPVPPIL